MLTALPVDIFTGILSAIFPATSLLFILVIPWPVFDYVDEMIENEQFSDLKGLIYFTDGYGIYPETKKNYDVAFVFLGDDENAPKVPPWAIKVILTEEDIMINE